MKKTTLILTTIALIVLIVVIGRLYITQADFSPENPYWNGLSGLSGVNVRPLYSLDDLQANNATTLLIVSPQKDFTVQESGKVASFLRSGGRVVVMDDFGRSDSLLSNLSSPILIDQVPLCEYENYYVNSSFPVVTKFNPSTETANVSKLVFNHPASLDVSGEAYVLAYTSERAWLDLNDNGKLDGAEHMGIYSVAARADLGNGELLVIADPDLFINGMAQMGDNSKFMANSLTGTVYVDVSHGTDITPLGELFYAVKFNPFAQGVIVILTLICGLIILKRDTILEFVKNTIARKPGKE